MVGGRCGTIPNMGLGVALPVLLMLLGVVLFTFDHAIVGSLCLLAGGALILRLGNWLGPPPPRTDV